VVSVSQSVTLPDVSAEYSESVFMLVVATAFVARRRVEPAMDAGSSSSSRHSYCISFID
jgi:hypothetical protein